MMAPSYIGIGSNLGRRKKNIISAVNKIRALKSVSYVKLSGIIETEPERCPRQNNFLNAVLKIRTESSARELLIGLQKIEKELGRQRAFRYGPRTIDLDILLYAGKLVNEEDLQIPHPLMRERDFVIRPLLEVI